MGVLIMTGVGTCAVSITSGPGSFVGSPTCSYTGGGSTASCTVVITSATTGTTVVSATSSIPLASKATRIQSRNDPTANTDQSCKTSMDATLPLTLAPVTNSTGPNH